MEYALVMKENSSKYRAENTPYLFNGKIRDSELGTVGSRNRQGLKLRIHKPGKKDSLLFTDW